MTLTNRTTVTRSTTTRTLKVSGLVNGLGARFAGFRATPAMSIVPGATPSRGYAGIDAADHQPDRDCQSRGLERLRRSEVADKRLWQAAKPANPN